MGTNYNDPDAWNDHALRVAWKMLQRYAPTDAARIAATAEMERRGLPLVPITGEEEAAYSAEDARRYREKEEKQIQAVMKRQLGK